MFTIEKSNSTYGRWIVRTGEGIDTQNHYFWKKPEAVAFAKGETKCFIVAYIEPRERRNGYAPVYVATANAARFWFENTSFMRSCAFRGVVMRHDNETLASAYHRANVELSGINA